MMERAIRVSTLSVCLLRCSYGQPNLNWWPQVLESPYGGEHTGVKVFDANNDGYGDLFFAAGRHGIDQSYMRMNLGFDEMGYHRFSDPIPIGEPGGFYQVAITRLSSLPQNHIGVLLAGGTCGEPEVCENGSEQPAVLLDVAVTGCSVFQPWLPCSASYSVIWEDPSPGGDRNGAFEMSLGDTVDPAMILIGKEGIKVFEPSDGVYSDTPTFLLTQAEKRAETNAFIRRASSLATGYIGKHPGFVCGVRTFTARNPLIAVFKNDDGIYDWFDFAGDGDAYVQGTSQGFTEATGLAMGDLDGDGIADIVEASFLNPAFIQDEVIVNQTVYFITENADENSEIDGATLFRNQVPGYSVGVGNLYSDSDLPDVVHGMLDGSIHIFANLGSSNGVFAGFRRATVLNVPPQCQIRDLTVTSLAPCTVSIVTALLCLADSPDNGIYLFTAVTECAPTSSPSPSFWKTISPWPTSTTNWPTWSPTTTWSPTSSPWPSSKWPTGGVEKVVPSQDTSTPSFSPSAGLSFTEPTLSGLLSHVPTDIPSIQPTSSLSPLTEESRSYTPSGVPTNTHSMSPSRSPTLFPSTVPSEIPSLALSENPTSTPSNQPPTKLPSGPPILSRSEYPSYVPSIHAPSAVPSDFPSLVPSMGPTVQPTKFPSSHPSWSASAFPSFPPSDSPSAVSTSPTIAPTAAPTANPTTTAPTLLPSLNPTGSPTRKAVENAEAPNDRSPVGEPTSSPNRPTSSPDPFVEAVENPDIEDFDMASDEKESHVWQYAALGASILFILVGCAGLSKVVYIYTRSLRSKVPTENSVISLYLEEDEIKGIGK